MVDRTQGTGSIGVFAVMGGIAAVYAATMFAGASAGWEVASGVVASALAVILFVRAGVDLRRRARAAAARERPEDQPPRA